MVCSENLGLAAIVCIRERRTRRRESEGTWARSKQKLRPRNTNEPFSTLNGADSRRPEPLLVWRRFCRQLRDKRHFVALIKPQKKGQTLFGANEISPVAAWIRAVPGVFCNGRVQAEAEKSNCRRTARWSADLVTRCFQSSSIAELIPVIYQGVTDKGRAQSISRFVQAREQRPSFGNLGHRF